MKNVGKAIYHRLSTDATILALVKAGDAPARIYPHVVPEAETVVLPLLVYKVEDQDRNGTYTGDAGNASCKVVVGCMALDPLALQDIRDAVIACLDNESGTWADVVIQGAFLEDENKLADRDPTTGEESLYFGSELEFLVWYET